MKFKRIPSIILSIALISPISGRIQATQETKMYQQVESELNFLSQLTEKQLVTRLNHQMDLTGFNWIRFRETCDNFADLINTPNRAVQAKLPDGIRQFYEQHIKPHMEITWSGVIISYQLNIDSFMAYIRDNHSISAHTLRTWEHYANWFISNCPPPPITIPASKRHKPDPYPTSYHSKAHRTEQSSFLGLENCFEAIGSGITDYLSGLSVDDTHRIYETLSNVRITYADFKKILESDHVSKKISVSKRKFLKDVPTGSFDTRFDNFVKTVKDAKHKEILINWKNGRTTPSFNEIVTTTTFYELAADNDAAKKLYELNMFNSSFDTDIGKAWMGDILIYVYLHCKEIISIDR